MKFVLLAVLLISYFRSITQSLDNKKGKSSNNLSTRDVNNVKGNQTINNYYYTINNNYNSRLSGKDNAINATRGFFKRIKDTTSHPPFVKFGGFAGHSNQHIIVFGDNPVDPINVNKVKGQIKIDVVLRDSNGDEYARIDGDSWEISNINNIEYNNDSSAFEIRSGKRVLFQIEIIKDTVFCYGMLCSENGSCIYGYQDSHVATPVSPIKPSQRFVLPPDLILQPIFRYPRFEYLGVRDTTQRSFNKIFR